MELFKKVYIKTEANLPKEVGDYNVGLKTLEGRILHYPFYGDVGFEIDKAWWLNEVDFWLQPIEITDADIEVWANEWEPEPDYDYRANFTTDVFRTGLLRGAKAVINGEIKHEL